jgi:hypothetical protein
MSGRRAFYSGCLDVVGHYFWLTRRQSLLYPGEIMRAVPDFIPSWAEIWDGGLLKNGKRPDVYDGNVYAVPAKGWLAFAWWDNSIDRRGASNSGFYVAGFEWKQREAALAFAMMQWPEVVARQRQPLALVAL